MLAHFDAQSAAQEVMADSLTSRGGYQPSFTIFYSPKTCFAKGIVSRRFAFKEA